MGRGKGYNWESALGERERGARLALMTPSSPCAASVPDITTTCEPQGQVTANSLKDRVKVRAILSDIPGQGGQWRRAWHLLVDSRRTLLRLATQWRGPRLNSVPAVHCLPHAPRALFYV